MNAGSAVVTSPLRWEARGTSIVSGSERSKSIHSISVCRTVVMIIEPPGEPTASRTLPSRVTIVGDIEERGRLPPSARLAVSVSS
jgi:hypothetical protein